jgi:hypothetical protein
MVHIAVDSTGSAIIGSVVSAAVIQAICADHQAIAIHNFTLSLDLSIWICTCSSINTSGNTLADSAISQGVL